MRVLGAVRQGVAPRDVVREHFRHFRPLVNGATKFPRLISPRFQKGQPFSVQKTVLRNNEMAAATLALIPPEEITGCPSLKEVSETAFTHRWDVWDVPALPEERVNCERCWARPRECSRRFSELEGECGESIGPCCVRARAERRGARPAAQRDVVRAGAARRGHRRGARRRRLSAAHAARARASSTASSSARRPPSCSPRTARATRRAGCSSASARACRRSGARCCRRSRRRCRPTR